jgi:2TM domain
MESFVVTYNEKITAMSDIYARAKAGFYSHLLGFGIITVLIIIFYLLTSLATGQFYFFLPVLFIPVWALGLAIHFATVFFLKKK